MTGEFDLGSDSVVALVVAVVAVAQADYLAAATAVDTERIAGSVESDSLEFVMVVVDLVVLAEGFDTGHQVEGMKVGLAFVDLVIG